VFTPDEPVDFGTEVERDAFVSKSFTYLVTDGLSERRKHAVGTLEEMNVEVVGDEGLGHLDTDVAAADDGDRFRGRQFAVPFDERPVDVFRKRVHIDVGRLVEIGPKRRGRVHAMQGEHTPGVHAVEGSGQGVCPGSDQQVAVGLFGSSGSGLDRDRPCLRIDGDDCPSPPQVDTTVGNLRRGQREKIAEVLDVTFHVVRRSTVGIRDPLALFEDDDVSFGRFPFALARGAQSGRVTTDDDEWVGHTGNVGPDDLMVRCAWSNRGHVPSGSSRPSGPWETPSCSSACMRRSAATALLASYPKSTEWL
jgi:hypothetical protein